MVCKMSKYFSKMDDSQLRSVEDTEVYYILRVRERLRLEDGETEVLYMSRSKRQRHSYRRSKSEPKLITSGPSFLQYCPQIIYSKAGYYRLQYLNHPYPPFSLRLPYVSYLGLTRVVYQKPYTRGTGHLRGLAALPDEYQNDNTDIWPIICQLLATNETDLTIEVVKILGMALAACHTYFGEMRKSTLLGLALCCWPMRAWQSATRIWGVIVAWHRRRTRTEWKEEVD